MKRVLFIGYHFHPEYYTPHTFHTEGIAVGLSKSGFHVDLVIPSHKGREGFLEKRNIENLKIHIIEPGYKFLSIVGRSTQYALSAVDYIKKTGLHKEVDLMLSTASPFSCHMAGLIVKRANKALPWFADYGDPHTFNPFNQKPLTLKQHLTMTLLKRKIDEWIERAAVKRMEKIVIPVEEARIAYYNLNVRPEQLEVIPLLYEYMTEEYDYKNLDDTRLNILYAGAFDFYYRNPGEFLAAYKKLIEDGKKLRLHFFGDVTDLNRYLTELDMLDKEKFQIFENVYIPRPNMLYLMTKMDLLVNINNAFKEQLPSKVIDYINSGIRVMNIGNTLFDEFVNVKSNRDEIYDKLLTIDKVDRQIDYGDLAKRFNYELNLKKYVQLLS